MLVRTLFWPSVREKAIKAFSECNRNVPLSKAVSALIFPSKTPPLPHLENS